MIDVRGETWRDTAGHRSTFSRCLKLALTQPGSIRFNPLLEIRKGTGAEFMDAAMLGEMVDHRRAQQSRLRPLGAHGQVA